MAMMEVSARTLGARGMGARLVVAIALAWCAQVAAQETLDEAGFLRLQACLDLPDEQRLACVEPLVAELPPTIARGFREQADPAWRAMVDRHWRAWEQALSRHAHLLADAGGARNLAAAALLLPDQRPVPSEPLRTDAAAAWYAQAQEEGADDPLLAQLDVSACQAFRPHCPEWAERVERAIALAPGEAPSVSWRCQSPRARMTRKRCARIWAPPRVRRNSTTGLTPSCASWPTPRREWRRPISPSLRKSQRVPRLRPGAG